MFPASLKSNKTTVIKTISVLVPVLLAIIILFAGCGKKEGKIAKVGSEYIYADEFKDAMIKLYRNVEFASLRELEDRRTLARNIADNKLKALDAYSMGLDQDSTIVASAEESRKQAAIQELYRVAIMEKVVPPEAVREHYDKMGEEIKARHMLFRTIPDLEESEIEEVLANANKAMEALKNGADFDSLAREVSEDGTTSQNGGDLGWFSWGRMVDEFQGAAFALEIGEISELIKSSYGYHIILLEGRRESQSRKDFDEEKDNIMQTMRRTFQDELTKAAEMYLEEIKEGKELSYNYANIQKILDKVSDPSVPRNNSYFADFAEDEKAWVVATLVGDTITVSDLDEQIAKIGRPPQWRDQKSIIQLVERMVLPDFLADHAEELGLYKSESVKKNYKSSLEIAMIRRVEEIKIEEKIEVNDTTMLEYYNDNLQDFMTDSTVEIQEIYVVIDEEKGKDKKYADKIAKRAKRGENFTSLVKKYSDRKSTTSKNGKIGPITSRQYGAIGRHSFKMEKGEISDPIKMGRNGYSIVKLLKKTPSVPKEFDVAKPQVERQLRQTKEEKLREEWMAELEKRYPVTIYDDQLMKVLPKPEKDQEAVAETPKPKAPEPKMKQIPIKPKKGEGN
ncbi:hypothetical protein CEE37_04640 [candidate division LCP-89 bacterium B3_LCP]|uniref:PpiC domain-containing protein n=1 Tax=candidate division LCP-89 bacterium B3_LCP TaxID=2012998 RepID=A0A532V3R5_UNCL8|nr:MAG: hypothetical protein CEE37_04640 [candidate division LCP-89 bacterium B3_LCP]